MEIPEGPAVPAGDPKQHSTRHATLWLERCVYLVAMDYALPMHQAVVEPFVLWFALEQYQALLILVS